MAARRSGRLSQAGTVYLAAQVRDTLDLWAVDGDGARPVQITDIPVGSVVLRASERDVRLSADPRRSAEAVARTELGERPSVLAGRDHALYATPAVDTWIFRDRQLRAAPFAALLDEAIRRQTLTPPAVLGLHLGGDAPLLVLWAWGRDGRLSFPLVVVRPPDGEQFDLRLLAYAREHGIAEDRIALLEAADVVALAARHRRPYPLASEWHGFPAQTVAGLALLVAGGLLAVTVLGRVWIDGRNADLRTTIARERDRAALIAQRHALAAGHVVAYAQLAAAQPAGAFAAAEALRLPATRQVLGQDGRGTRITLTQEFPRGDATESPFYRQRLAALLDLPVPPGMRREGPRVREGGGAVVIDYVRD